MDVSKAGLPTATKVDASLGSSLKAEEKPIPTDTANASKPSGLCTKGKNLEEKPKLETAEGCGELLGSVITHNCPGVRASARVIQKMKQDSIRPTTPPPIEKDSRAKEEKSIQKTPSQAKPSTKATWTNIERNYFFDALNEFGKDFDSIGNFINSKLKRKSSTDAAFKTKDQVRQHYYQTFHKICKYVRFTDEVKKPVQELYTLINYGEMRRKLQFVTDKHFMKLKHLVYSGHITVRCKGKNIRVKTPTCKALRRLNQLDDSLEDIKLPSKIEVIICPANMESFGKVQVLAQNPKAKATVSLQKKLVNFIKTFQYKWRSSDMKLAEEEPKVFSSHPMSDTEQVAFQDAQMCFRPKPGVPIHRPLLNITEYLSSLNLCLSAYEDRIGVRTRSETLCQDRMSSNKRHRCDSGSEKRSPDNKKFKSCELLTDSAFPIKDELSGMSAHHSTENEYSNNEGDLSDELNEILNFSETKGDSVSEIGSDGDVKNGDGHQQGNAVENGTTIHNHVTTNDNRDPTHPLSNDIKSKHVKRRKEHKKNESNFKPLISDDVIKKIRKGWTVLNSDDITIGDLYVVFGQDSKLELEYFWTETDKKSIFNQKQNGMPYSIHDCDEPDLVNSLAKSTLGNKLKHLLLIANLSERIRKKQCSCGHTCDKMSKSKIDREIVTKSFVSSKTFQLSSVDTGVFRQPVVPFRRPTFSLDAIKQTANGSRLKMSKQVLVQRLLLPHRSEPAYDVVEVKDLQNKFVETNESPAASNGNVQSSSDSTPEIPANNEQNKTTVATAPIQDQSDSITTDSPNTDSSVAATSTHESEENGVFLNEQNTDLIEFDECSTSSIFKGIPPMSPMQLLRDSTSNSRWLEENLNDFSLNSLLGHLDEINGNRDITDQSSNLSIISESSVDYMTKFAEITASMQNEEKDL